MIVNSIVILDFTNSEVYVLEYNPDLDAEFQINKFLSNMTNGATLENCEYMVVNNIKITFFKALLQG
jgi:hypothetical protein